MKCVPGKAGIFIDQKEKCSEWKRTLSNEEINEKQLISRSAGGDKAAYRMLVERYHSRVFALVRGLVRSTEDAEDITQETFVKAYLSLKSFQGNSSFYTWIYRIAFNMTIDFKRKMNRRGGSSVELNEEITGSDSALALSSPGEGPDEAIGRKEIGGRIHNAIQELSDTHRAVFVLREFDGLSYDEIATVVGVSRGTVMSRLHYARKHLQERLKDLRTPDSENLEEMESAPLTSGDNARFHQAGSD